MSKRRVYVSGIPGKRGLEIELLGEWSDVQTAELQRSILELFFGPMDWSNGVDITRELEDTLKAAGIPVERREKEN